MQKIRLVIPALILVGILFIVVPSSHASDEDDVESTANVRITMSPKASRTPKPSGLSENDGRGGRDESKTLEERAKELREQKKNELKSLRPSGSGFKSAAASARAEMRSKLCERISENIVDVSNRYESNHKGNLERYKNLKDKVTKIVTRLKAEGINTSALETALKELEIKINAVGIAHTAYLKELQEVKALGCNASEDQIKAARDEAKTQLAKVRAAADAVREYYRNVIRAEIIKLKSQLPSRSPRASASSTAIPTPSSTTQPTVQPSASAQ